MSAVATSLPPLVVSDVDHDRILSLLDTELAARHSRTAEVLRAELERADVVPQARVPPDVVRMGSCVHYSDSFGRRAIVELVYPWDATTDGRCVSILSPLGASLIGLRQGARFDWRSASGRVLAITVLSVTRPSG
jgi:regulator of nucleoside diphosphate kinase